MAEEKKDPSAAAPKAASSKDLVSQIGTLTYPRAVAAFGKENALKAMHRVAEIGGHGMFEDAHFLSPLFGGLAMPDPELVPKVDRADFDRFGESADFYYSEAMEQYNAARKRSTDDRATINDYYNSLK